MVMGQEERKNKAKLEKTQINLATSSTEYENAVKILEETTGRWVRDWKAAADKFQDLEEERLDFTKSSLWNYANIASTVCVSDDASCEKIRLSLENCEVEKDVQGFIKERGTGQEIPDPPKYINFVRGDINDTHSETSEDDNYSVAQFPRTINPSYRTSSPQPSTYESHHDPNSSLARDFGHGDPGATSSRENTLTPQKAQQVLTDRPRPSDNQQQMGRSQYGQTQQQASRYDQSRQQKLEGQQQPTRHQLYDQSRQQQVEIQQQPVRHQLYDQPRQQQIEVQQQPVRHQLYDRPVQPSLENPQPKRQPQLENQSRQNRLQYDQAQHGQVSAVPHDPYPMDGMTMLCRTAPPSERSSAASPNRPSSRDSQSECSNPTSFSSQEPSSGKQSPTKQDVVISPTSDRTIQKKRSMGFFQAKSPFRRKSRHEKENSSSSPESHRNTWSASNQATPNHNRRQTYTQQNMKNMITGREDGSPEEVDPRATYQLNIGNNVFDVAGPERKGMAPQRSAAQEHEDLDPIAKALADLQKGVNKQSSLRMSADHYHGIATPAPGSSRPIAPMMSGALVSGMRGTPPPSYDQPVQRLGLPQPAFTSKAMQQSTQKYVAQTQDIFNSPTRIESQQQRLQSRPGTRGNDVPRATSPLPARGTSPRPINNIKQDQRQFQSTPPNQHSGNSPRSSSQCQGSPRTPQSANLQQCGSAQGYYRQNSPRVYSPMEAARTASPAPFRDQQSRPGSSHAGSDMAVQLAPDPEAYRGGSPSQYAGSQYAGSQYGGSQQGRDNMRPSTGNGRPMTYYNGAQGGQLQMAPSTRQRSKSVVDGRQFTREGRPILHFGKHPDFPFLSCSEVQTNKSIARAMYMYSAAIPEELSFAKGDTLAILRLQDDGWWEAEIAGKIGRPGLVPSNYLQKI